MLKTPFKQKQAGIALVISLIMLLLLTTLGVANMRVNNFEEKMAGNARDKNIAFQTAESTLRQAENFILANPLGATYTGQNGLLDIANPEPVDYFARTWTNDNSQEATNPNTTFNLAANPRYVIKKISSVGRWPNLATHFRITARAVGRSASTQVILQEDFVRKN